MKSPAKDAFIIYERVSNEPETIDLNMYCVSILMITEESCFF